MTSTLIKPSDTVKLKSDVMTEKFHCSKCGANLTAGRCRRCSGNFKVGDKVRLTQKYLKENPNFKLPSSIISGEMQNLFTVSEFIKDGDNKYLRVEEYNPDVLRTAENFELVEV